MIGKHCAGLAAGATSRFFTLRCGCAIVDLRIVLRAVRRYRHRQRVSGEYVDTYTGGRLKCSFINAQHPARYRISGLPPAVAFSVSRPH